MQNRIDRLEGLVLSLMTNGAQSAGPAAAAAAISRSQSDSAGSSSLPFEVNQDDEDMIKEEEGDESEVEGVTNSLGVLKVDADKGKSMYFGESHWHMVLADVRLPFPPHFLIERYLRESLYLLFLRESKDRFDLLPTTSLASLVHLSDFSCVKFLHILWIFYLVLSKFRNKL